MIEIPEREKKRVDILMTQIDQREKTLVFCASQAHALAVRDTINQIKSSKDPNYCQRVRIQEVPVRAARSVKCERTWYAN